MGIFSSLFGRKPVAEPFGRVDFDDSGATFRCGDRVETIAWVDLVEIGILTTDEGPFREDVYFLLIGPTCEKGCAIPQGAGGSQKLVERLQALAGFDHEAVIRAMGCTSNARFVCWRK